MHIKTRIGRSCLISSGTALMTLTSAFAFPPGGEELGTAREKVMAAAQQATRIAAGTDSVVSQAPLGSWASLRNSQKTDREDLLAAAREAFQEASGQDRRDARIILRRCGQLLYQEAMTEGNACPGQGREKLQQATEYLQRAAQEGDPSAAFFLAEKYWNNGEANLSETSLALDHYEEAAFPPGAHLEFELGEYCRHFGLTKEAREYFSNAYRRKMTRCPAAQPYVIPWVLDDAAASHLISALQYHEALAGLKLVPSNLSEKMQADLLAVFLLNPSPGTFQIQGGNAELQTFMAPKQPAGADLYFTRLTWKDGRSLLLTGPDHQRMLKSFLKILTQRKGMRLSQIHISNTALDHESLEALLGVIKGLDNLESLLLEKVELDDDGTRKILRALPGKTGLKQLGLSGNRITDACLSGLRACYRQLPALNYLDLSGNHFSAPAEGTDKSPSAVLKVLHGQQPEIDRPSRQALLEAAEETFSTSIPQTENPGRILRRAGVLLRLEGLEQERQTPGLGQEALAEARSYFRRAADKGDAHAAFSLAEMYWNGEGRPRETSLALQYYGKAAKLLGARSELCLAGICLRNGAEDQARDHYLRGYTRKTAGCREMLQLAIPWKLDDEGAEQLTTALIHREPIAGIKVAGEDLLDEIWQELATAIMQHPYLQTFEVAGKDVAAELVAQDGRSIADRLELNRLLWKGSRTLVIEGPGQKKACSFLRKLLQGGLPLPTRIEIRNMELAGKPFEALLDFLRCHTGLEELVIEDAGLLECRAVELFDVLNKSTPKLRTLGLARNLLGDRCIPQLGACCAKLPCLARLELSGNQFSPGAAGRLNSLLPRVAVALQKAPEYAYATLASKGARSLPFMAKTPQRTEVSGTRPAAPSHVIPGSPARPLPIPQTRRKLPPVPTSPK